MALFYARDMKKVAILGRRGSFHEEAALAYFQDVPLDLSGFDSFEQMLAAYDAAEVDAVVIAVENTLSGGLVRNLELIHSGGYQISGEVLIPVHQYLMALPGQSLESIREVRSHEMALYQTRAYLEKNLPGAALTRASSTVAAVQEVVSGRLEGVAAVASRLAAQEYGLEILAREIESFKENMTRFFVLDRYYRPEKPDKASWCFTLPHKAGALAQILTILSFYEMNLTRIQSLPIPGCPWEYFFYADIRFDDSVRYRQALSAVRPLLADLDVMGIYKGSF
jgi:prephenate dehydratase